jgi:DNA-binding PadR family transcriptional regulator
LTNARTPTIKHAYAILKLVEGLGTGRERLSTSTLYEALARLLEQGWIERVRRTGKTHTAGALQQANLKLLPTDKRPDSRPEQFG